MSRSLNIKMPKWHPEDAKFLSFFGTLLHGMKVDEARHPTIRFELRRQRTPVERTVTQPSLPILHTPAKCVAVNRQQKQTLCSIARAAQETGYAPKALPSSTGVVVIEMGRISDGEVPVYARSA